MRRDELVVAGRVLAREGLVDAYGHLSTRDEDGATITPPDPLGALRTEGLLHLPLDERAELPDAVPKEGWIHHAILRRRPDAGAVCRAQPPSTLSVGAVAGSLPALFGQAALVGADVPIFDEARLVRERDRAEALAEAMGDGWALILRGNGAVTAGKTLGHAVARMVLLERSARVLLQALAAGQPRALKAHEVAAWQDAGDGLLDRLWAHLADGA